MLATTWSFCGTKRVLIGRSVVMHQMDELRQHLRLVHTGQLRVVFESQPGLGFLVPSFECTACERNLDWNFERGWWNCPECGYELTTQEAVLLVGRLKAGLNLLKRDVSRRNSGGFWTWLLAKLFGRQNQKQIPPSFPSSPRNSDE